MNYKMIQDEADKSSDPELFIKAVDWYLKQKRKEEDRAMRIAYLKENQRNFDTGYLTLKEYEDNIIKITNMDSKDL